MLAAVLFGVVLGALLGGRLGGLALPFRWASLAFAGLGLQLIIFWGPIARLVGDAGPPLYVASTLVVLGVVVANVAVARGLALVAAGAAANLAAIVANAGYMPALPEALVAAGRGPAEGYSNSVTSTAPALAPLVDRFAIPAELPFANVFSVGDVLIAAGIAIVIVAAMVRPSPSVLTPTGQMKARSAPTGPHAEASR